MIDLRKPFVLNEEQQVAHDKIMSWVQNPNGKRWFTLIGIGGSGKSSVISKLNFENKNIIYLSPTGKAAEVVNSKLKSGMCYTIHSYIYNLDENAGLQIKKLEREQDELLELAYQTTDNEHCYALQKTIRGKKERITEIMENDLFQLKGTLGVTSTGRICEIDKYKKDDIIPLEFSNTVVIIDEVSMVSRRLAEDLLKFFKYALVLAVGDFKQIPPVNTTSKEYIQFFYENAKGEVYKPDAELETIMRTDNAIASFCKKYRNKRPEGLTPGFIGDNKEIEIVRFEDLGLHHIEAADQIIAGTNTVVSGINKASRELLKKKSVLDTGDKLLCIRNSDLDTESDISKHKKQTQFKNGQTWIVKEVSRIERLNKTNSCFYYKIECLVYKTTNPNILIKLPLIYIYGEFRIDNNDLTGEKLFIYGYGITVHKAQGSEYNTVLFFDTKFGKYLKSDPYNVYTKHFYTACSRASQVLIIVVNVPMPHTNGVLDKYGKLLKPADKFKELLITSIYQ